MGMLINGKWEERWYDTSKSGGRFVRDDARFRSWVRHDGSTKFPAQAGRYHLYVSNACPWANRTVIFRALKGLEELVGLTVVEPLWTRDQGWEFGDGPGCTPDPLFGAQFVHEIYTHAKPDYTGRVTIPILWDKVAGTMVSNESSEIIRMFNSEFDHIGATPGDYYPEPLREEIDAVNARIYDTVNNGVYRCGFATTQSAYEEAFDALFDTLDMLEERLATRRYLTGARVTEADWRFFTTLMRFDAVYYGHFKCNQRRIADCPNLWGYTRELYQWPGVAATIDFTHIKDHYYRCHTSVNPTGIVPKGPAIDFDAPHGRG